MTKIIPEIGDYIEVEDDGCGTADNGPWTAEVVDIAEPGTNGVENGYKGYYVNAGKGEERRFYMIPDKCFYKESTNEDGKRFVYANNKHLGIEEIPSSTVPVMDYKDSSVQAYKEGIIKPDNYPVSEEKDIDPLRGVSLEDSGSVVYFIDVLDDRTRRAFKRATDIMTTTIADGVISNESFKNVQNTISDISDKFKHLISSRHDICYIELKRIKEIENKLHDYTPPKSSYETKFANDIHVNNSLDHKQILIAAQRQLKLAQFISDRYKDTLHKNLSSIVTEINKQAKRNYLENKINLGSLKKIINDVSKDIKETLSLTLVDLIVGVSEKRQLIGGYTLERVPDWKNNLINIGYFLGFTKGYSLDTGRLITIDKATYQGNGEVTPLSKSEVHALLKTAKDIIDESLVSDNKIIFTTKEFSDLIDSAYVNVEDEHLIKKLMLNKDTAIEKQIAGASMFPVRIIYRNIKAATAIINFVDEAIQRGNNERLSS